MLKFGGVLVAAAALLVAAQPAGATAPRVHAPTVGVHVNIGAQGGVHPDSPPSSDVGAGYFATPGSPNVSSASAQFTVPAISCSGNHINEGIFPGIWVYDSSGTLTQQVDLNMYCLGGEIHYVDVVCIAGSSEGCVTGGLTINPGDRILLSFSESPYHTQGQIYDTATGLDDHIYDGTAAPTSDYTVFIGDAGPAPFGFSNHIPIFTHILFSKVQVDGYYLFEYFPTLNQLKSASILQVKTSHLHGDGDSFNTTFAHI